MDRTAPAPALVSDTAEVAELADAIRRAGSFAFDLEFVSADRYVPDLALVQVAFGDPDAPRVALVDPLAVDPAPLFELIADPEIEVLAHAARQDLGLLGALGTVARRLIDTQIASAFAGLADQIGYGKMVQHLLGIALDKGSQFTDWKRRPLREAQLRYAADDVRHLQRAWQALRGRLEQRGRLAWAIEESERLAASAGVRRPPEEAYRGVGGWQALRGAALATLRELAGWREREALASNTPPSWLAPDPALVELARRAPRRAGELGRVRGLPAPTVREHGEAIVAAVARGASAEVPAGVARQAGPREQAQAAMVLAIVQARCGEADLPVRLVGGKSDAEALVSWFVAGEPDGAGVTMLEGWRAELCGRDALAWLRGERALVADRAAAGGVKLVPLS